MVNAAYIQSKVNYGLGKAAIAAGDPYAWYRPQSATAPVGPLSLLGTIQANFAQDPGLTFARPSQYGKGSWYGMFDPTYVQPGDYMIGELGTFFVTDIERFNPPQCVWCNRTVSIERAAAAIGPGGSTDYGGSSVQNPATILSGWPVSELLMSTGSKMTPTGMQLPSDAKLPAAVVLIPSFAGVPVQWNDIIVDDLGHRYTVSMSELTPLGWRLTAEMWPT